MDRHLYSINGLRPENLGKAARYAIEKNCGPQLANPETLDQDDYSKAGDEAAAIRS
jgi:hypothetical protein